MKDKVVLSKFIFIGNRISSFKLETRQIEIKKQKANVSFDFDYNVKGVQQHENRLLGVIEFIVKVKAKVKRRMLFKVELVMEGAFGIESGHFTDEKFYEMLEINGLVTLSQISRAYILSVTAQSGINPPVRIPMININKLREMKEQGEKI